MSDADRPNERLIQKKVRWAGAARRVKQPSEASRERVPPGQHLPSTWPVLDLGIKPRLTTESWRLEISGLVAAPLSLGWSELQALPPTESVSDFHCVTTWSTLDNRWTGVRFRDLAEQVKPLPECGFVLLGAYDGYTTNLPLVACLEEDVLLAYSWGGRPLDRDHGGPVRLVVPRRYGWKSIKWVRSLEFSARDRPGFWETRGYHNQADPWKEERFA